jgi:hypothetical protein
MFFCARENCFIICVLKAGKMNNPKKCFIIRKDLAPKNVEKILSMAADANKG